MPASFLASLPDVTSHQTSVPWPPSESGGFEAGAQELGQLFKAGAALPFPPPPAAMHATLSTKVSPLRV
jgi:phage tail protein X